MRPIYRNAQGVRLVNFEEGDQFAGVDLVSTESGTDLASWRACDVPTPTRSRLRWRRDDQAQGRVRSSAVRFALHPAALVACATEVERRFNVRGRLDWDGASVDPLSVEPYRFEAQIEVRSSEPGPGFELDLLLPRAPSLSQRVELRLVTQRGVFIAPLLIPAEFSGDPAKLGGQLAPAQR